MRRGEYLLNRPHIAAALDAGQHGLARCGQTEGDGLAETRVGPVSLVTRLVSLIPGDETQDADNRQNNHEDADNRLQAAPFRFGYAFR